MVVNEINFQTLWQLVMSSQWSQYNYFYISPALPALPVLLMLPRHDENTRRRLTIGRDS